MEYKGYKIRIEPDGDPQNPRGDDDGNIGKMICFHRRYDLGDKHDYRHEDYGGWEAMEAAIREKEEVAVILPLYLYDHSGITINTTGFSCGWDSGQVGFIFVSKAKLREFYLKKRLTASFLEKVKEWLRDEVKTYDQYLTGDVYGYVIEDSDGNEMDSCWGFYGEESCLEEAQSVVNTYKTPAEREVAAGI